MQYFVLQFTNTEITKIAEFDDENYAIAFIEHLTDGMEEVNPRDTDPQTIHYEVTDYGSTNNEGLERDDQDYDPCGPTVYTSKSYYND